MLNTNKHSALIIVDVQNDYCDEKGALGSQRLDTSGVDRIIPHIKKLISTFHNSKLPVIFIQTIHEDATDSEVWLTRGKSNDTEHNSVCRKDTWGSDFYQLSPDTTDIIVNKHRYSAFYNTRLDSVLRTLKIDHLYITGVATNVCVDSTIRDGFMRDYKITVLEDGTAAFSKEAHEMTLKTISDFFGEVANTDSVIEELIKSNKSIIQV